jgi:membrane protein
VGTLRRAAAVRITGLAAEMAYYAIVSLVPLLTAIGASLGFLERLLGQERVTEIEAALIGGLGVVFAPDVTSGVIAPIVREVLREERTAVAVGSALIALLLVARVFRSAGRALDVASGATPRRGLGSWLVAVLLALAATVVVTLTLAAVVVGPLLGGGWAIADALDLGPAFEVVWGLWRWPAVFLVGVGFLVAVYRLAPSAGRSWRGALPGAVLAMAGAVLVALGLRAYLGGAVGVRALTPEEPAEAVALAGQVLGGVLAGALWAWLTNVVVLLGGVLNAELAAARAGRARDEPGLRAGE